MQGQHGSSRKVKESLPLGLVESAGVPGTK